MQDLQLPFCRATKDLISNQVEILDPLTIIPKRLEKILFFSMQKVGGCNYIQSEWPLFPVDSVVLVSLQFVEILRVGNLYTHDLIFILYKVILCLLTNSLTFGPFHHT
eukprot:Sdes_comp17268_c0_seq1m6468